MSHEQKPLREALTPILDTLKQLSGKFTFMDEDGTQFVLATADTLQPDQGKPQEQQLALSQAESVARAVRKHVDASLGDDVIERINRDIALTASSEQLEQQDEIEDLIELQPGIRASIRFEPIKGDLPPELQE